MGLKSWLGSKLINAVQKDSEIGGRFVLPSQSGKPYHKPSEIKDFVERYSSWVYACANRNAINCAQVPLALYVSKPVGSNGQGRFKKRTVEKEKVEYLRTSPSTRQYVIRASQIEELSIHPFMDLIQNVNEFMNGFELLETLFLHLEITGNGYWHIERDSFNTPVEIWPILPQYMKPIPHRKKFILGYEFSTNNVEKYIYEYEDIIHFKYPNPKDPIVGMGKLEACVVAADLSANMNIFETSLLKNSGRPDMALVLPVEAGLPNPEEQVRMRRDWYRRHGGARKSGNLAILSGGAKLENLTLTPKEMNFLKGRQATLEEIAGVFGVPISKLITKDVNRSNAETGNYTYLKDTILPMLRRVEQKLNEQLLPMYDQNLFVSFENPVPQDKEFRLRERESNINTGYTTINEERAKDGLNPVAWGDNPVGRTLPVTEPQKMNCCAFDTAVDGNTFKKAEPLQQPSDDLDPVFLAKIKSFFKEIENEVLKNFDKYPPNVEAMKTNKAKGGLPSDWFDMLKWNKKLSEIEAPFVRATYMIGGKAALKQLKSEFQFNSIAAGMENITDKRTGSIMDTNAVTQRQIRKHVAKGIEAGESTAKIRKRLSDYFKGDNIKYRAETIARTESIWAYNSGAVAGYQQSRVVKGKEWLTAKDDRLCQFCEPMDGVTVELEQNYFGMGEVFEGNKGGNLTFGYEDIGHPPLHPQCRCTIIPVLKEIKDG